MRPKMQPPTQRIWDWLRFIVIVETGQVTPAGVATQLDKACANHNPKDEPAEQPDDNLGRRVFWEGPGIEQRTKKNRQKSGFQQLNFPPVAVPVLPDMNEGHVKHPQDSH